jgi:hypothetical protein
MKECKVLSKLDFHTSERFSLENEEAKQVMIDFRRDLVVNVEMILDHLEADDGLETILLYAHPFLDFVDKMIYKFIHKINYSKKEDLQGILNKFYDKLDKESETLNWARCKHPLNLKRSNRNNP